jgi:hypothetical protein
MLLWIKQMKDVYHDARTADGIARIKTFVDSTVCAVTDPGLWRTHPCTQSPDGYTERRAGYQLSDAARLMRKRCERRKKRVVVRRRSSRCRRVNASLYPMVGDDSDPEATQCASAGAEDGSADNDSASESSSSDELCRDETVASRVVVDAGVEFTDEQLFDPPMYGGDRVTCLPFYHPLTQRRWRQLGDRVQMHKCSFTCWKKSKSVRSKPDAKRGRRRKDHTHRSVAAECRFRFPRPVCAVTKVVYDGSKPASPKIDVDVKQNHPMYNTCNPLVGNVWSANSDCRVVVHGYKVVKYTTTYVTKTDAPEDATLSDIVIARLRELQAAGKTRLYDRLMAVAMHDVGYQEICLEQAIWLLLSMPLVNQSHPVVLVDVSRHDAAADSVALLNAELLVERSDGESVVCDGVSSKRGRVTNYVERPKRHRLTVFGDGVADVPDGDVNYDVCLFDYLSRYDVREGNGKTGSGKGLPLENGRGYAFPRDKAAIVVPSPYCKVDTDDDSSCYMMLMFYVPFRHQERLLRQFCRDDETDITPCEAFRRAAAENKFFPDDLMVRIHVQHDIETYEFSEDDEEKSDDRRVSSNAGVDGEPSGGAAVTLPRVPHCRSDDDADATQVAADEVEKATGRMEAVDESDWNDEEVVVDGVAKSVTKHMAGYFGDLNKRRRTLHEAEAVDVRAWDEACFHSDNDDSSAARPSSGIPVGDVVSVWSRDARLNTSRVMWDEAQDFIDVNKARMHLLNKQSRVALMESSAKSGGSGVVASLQAVYDTLNARQRLAFDIVREHVASNKQLQLVVTGVAGTGKSHVCKAVVQYCRAVFGVLPYDEDAPYVDTVVTLAFTGVAANNINGHTIHSALSFRVFDGTAATTADLNKTNGRLRLKWKDVRMVIVDEFSFIGCSFLHDIDARLRLVMGQSDRPFGGLHVMFMGDMNQLRPVDRSTMPLFTRTFNAQVDGSYSIQYEKNLMDRLLWEGMTDVVVLNEQMRQTASSDAFTRVLSKIRDGTVTEADLVLINTRARDHSFLVKTCSSSHECM